MQYHRRSIRLKGYDYSSDGYYFITICVNKRLCLFGNIENKIMYLNGAGKIINKWWCKLTGKFSNTRLDEYIIMPNHMHGIIHIGGIVGADPCVCPYDAGNQNQINQYGNASVDNQPDKSRLIGKQSDERIPDMNHRDGHIPDVDHRGEHIPDVDHRGEHMGSPLQGESRISISTKIQWFKTMTTNEYIRNVKQKNWQPFYKKLWQRNYYERIIWNEKQLNTIRQYIVNNPMKWDKDINNT